MPAEPRPPRPDDAARARLASEAPPVAALLADLEAQGFTSLVLSREDLTDEEIAYQVRIFVGQGGDAKGGARGRREG